jgi:quercetin dioxygenase-like cupin family protein
MFTPFTLDGSSSIALSNDPFPTMVATFAGGRKWLEAGATHYGFLTEGEARVAWNDGDVRISAGMWFCLPEEVLLYGAKEARGLVISRLDYRGLPQFGGPVEPRGRLKYIDGCTDTLLVSPPVMGDPCLNHLHIPPGVDQTSHTHPSQRIGVILKGSGICETPDGRYALSPGMGWWIPTGQLHSFHTRESSLDVIAWHPDSDFGPTADDHPMVNKTFVGETSAREIAEIRTK